jgi:hypothetical protein
MAKYIVYSLTESGTIRRSDWLDADTDENALAAARAMNLPHGGELWQRDRRVGRIDAGADGGRT